MKIVQIAAGLADLNTSRPIGSQAERRHRAQQADQRIDHAVEERETSEHETRGDAYPPRRGPKPMATRCSELSTFQPMPWSLGPLAVERVGEQHDGGVERRLRCRERGAVLREQRPDADEQPEADDRRQHHEQERTPVEGQSRRLRRWRAGNRCVHRLGARRSGGRVGRSDGLERRVEDSRDHAVLPQPAVAALILKPSAYLAGSFPSQTTPSMNFALRIGSFGTLIFRAEAACL